MRPLTPVLVVALVALLAACGPDPVAPPSAPVPEPSATAPFADDAEALAAAEEAYAAYLAMSDLISAEGGANPERIAPFVTEEQLTRELESIERFAATGNRFVGSAVVSSWELQFFDPPTLVAYACYDVSATRVIDKNGVDVTPSDRPNRATLEVSFETRGAELVIAGSELWSSSC